MIRRAYTAVGTTVLFVLGGDRALRRFVRIATQAPPPPRPAPPAPYSKEWRKLPVAERRRLL